MSGEQIDILLTLNTIAELFAEPTADPFDPNSRYVSGIDEIVGQMRLKRRDLKISSRLVVRLPQAAVTTETQPTLKAAVNRYCKAKIAENKQVIDELRVGSRRETISAFIIAVVLILLTVLFSSYFPRLQALNGSIAGFVGIAVWVIFWDPIYNYVYAWRPNRLDIRVFENLQTTDLIVEGI